MTLYIKRRLPSPSIRAAQQHENLRHEIECMCISLSYNVDMLPYDIPTVPGCGGEDKYNNDYCIVKSVPNLLNRIGNGLGEDAFGLCEGDCDEDTDCQGDLICQQRDDLEPIVGCIGEGRSTTDYCRPPDATTTTQAPPSCTNDDNWIFVNRRGFEKNCDWVGNKPSKRCIKIGTNGVDAFTACPEYCGC